MAIASAGYSTRSLADKLGYRAGQRALFIALPDELAELPSLADFESAVTRPGWNVVLSARGFDLIHAFTRSRAELDAHLKTLQDALKLDGAIWVSWPKKASKVATDVTEDRVREAALALDLVDVKVAAIDAIWSGLKLVIRKERR
jgi:hypothetical protein